MHEVALPGTLDDTDVPDDWQPATDDPLAHLLRGENVRLCEQKRSRSWHPNTARVLVLREMEDLSYREIAAIADVPVGTVMSRLARGRHKLAALLGEPHRRPKAGRAVRRLAEPHRRLSMDCNEARALLDADVDRELSAPDALRVQQHVEGCEACRRERAIVTLVQPCRADYHRAPDALRASILASLPAAADAPGREQRAAAARTAVKARSRVRAAAAGFRG